VTLVSAPPGSGKTVLLGSWMSEASLAERAAWVPVGRDERDPRRFWLSVLDALRQTSPGASLVRALTAAPDLDGWTIAERLLKDLAPLAERLWLVIDDLHELASEQARQQLEMLMMRAPPELRFVLATRHDVRLGLHRLRLEGDLAEIRADDLRFSFEEAEALFVAAGVKLAEPTLEVLYEQTEGWAAGLRLAALSLAGHPDPDRFAAEFSGSERAVAEYLLAEVLDRQNEAVRQLLLRTSVLERVNGELADLLTGGSGGERVLHDLEEANAFVVPLNAARSWFRYHRLFAELLQLELRCAAPDEVTSLHKLAAGWLAEHGYPVEAIRHAQAARDWGLATRLLADHWPGLHLDGQAATVHVLLAGFPAGALSADAELAGLAAADELAQGSLEAAERHLGLAAQAAAGPAGRRGPAQVLLGVVRLLLARQRRDLPAVMEEAQRLQTLAGAPDAMQLGLSQDLRGLALLSLGITEFLWPARFEDAQQHLEQAIALARRIGRPYLEFSGLAYQALAQVISVPARAAEHARQAIDLAERHGWSDDPAACYACHALAAVLAWQGRPTQAEPWVQRAERIVRAEAEPATALWTYYGRGLLELTRGRAADALPAFQAGERMFEHTARSYPPSTSALHVQALVRLGELEQASRVLADLGEQDRERGEIHVALAMLRLARDEPDAATAALAPVLDGSALLVRGAWLAQAFILEAIARDALGDPDAAGRALESALDLAEPGGVLAPFVLHPAPHLLERHVRQRSAHAALVAEILDRLAGDRPGAAPAGPRPPLDPLSKSEIRVLRYLPTNLSAAEIGAELSVSTTTVRTHIRNLYAKLGAHRRAEAVESARALGLLAPPSRPR
jgi:LuxR family transcriptional regulator, maltose regulon positive regulatory protein